MITVCLITEILIHWYIIFLYLYPVQKGYHIYLNQSQV